MTMKRLYSGQKLVSRPAFGALLAACIFLADPAIAAPMDSGADRAALDATLSQMRKLTTLDDLIAQSDLVRAQVGLVAAARSQWVDPAPNVSAAKAATVELSDMRVALTQLAIQAGTNDHLTLVRAQAKASNAMALYVREGSIDLNTLADVVSTAAPGTMVRIPGGYRMMRPLVVWSDSTLVLESGQILELDTASGAFLLSFGSVDIVGATLRATPAPNPLQPTYRPFLLSLGEAEFSARDSVFEGLGFGRGTLFGGVAVANRGLFQPKRPPVVLRSTFVDTQALQFDGTTGATVRGNRFLGVAAGGLVISGGKNASVTGNSFERSISGAALRITRQASDILVSGNILIDSLDTAILVDGQSRNITLSDNLIDRANGAGVALRQSTCAILSGNLISRGGGTGLRMNEAGPTKIDGNTLVMNAAAGVQMDGHLPGGITTLTDNLFSANRFGLSGTDAGRIDLQGNTFSGQLPRLFGGEFGMHLPAFLEQQTSQSPDSVFEIVPPVFLKDSILPAAVKADPLGTTDPTSNCEG
jgi:hypothetical protein